MNKTIIVSNRLPVNLKLKSGKFEFKASAGGLATGLGSIYKQGENLWIGWPGNAVEENELQQEISTELKKLKMAPVFLTKEDIELYYEGFSNETIWPAFHYFTQYINYKDAYWDAYYEVNRKFCDAILAYAEPEDTIWVHDYQLLLLPMMLREALPDATIAFFQHIPFPSYEIIRMLPWRRQLLEGMVGADLIGFHTYDDMRHFLSAVGRILGLSNESGYIQADHRLVNVDSFPMGIDYDKFANAAISQKTLTKRKKFKDQLGGQKLLITIDRLDYSKGIPQRIRAFDRLLDQREDFHGKVSMIMVVVPSRAKVQSYKELKTEIDTLVGRINSKYSTLNWVPIHYFYRSFPFEELSAFYSMSDIALVTPLRDGMNLVCKEFVASKTDQDGVLILSEMAGASKELVDAILVNPNDISAVEQAIVAALTMSDEEKKSRIASMQSSLKKYDIFQWVEVFMDRLAHVKQKQQEFQSKALDRNIAAEIVSKFKEAERPIVFLDYDGTLVGFKSRPEDAYPDEELLEIVSGLANRCEVVLISGRDKETLGKWFENQKVEMIAEHGVWLKRGDQSEWELYADVDDGWKDDIRKVMDYYVLRTPGAFIEEKHHSLVWHYRKVESGLGDLRMRELFSHLKYMASGHNLQVLEGNMVLEIKRPDINKGRAANSFMRGNEYDFILALGDDWTDEDTFKAMPKDSYTIRVGYDYTQANYNIKNPTEVRKLLKQLMGSK
ncbi:bifunctional alpha,alpha-trehalose-phosphate synthase (UDP-forming)/trehalose-phosphatase [Lunatimonas salinarum]|uniref:bifunctional alpha,alpha-trehalose-phosphate synthase (UDP-forming)/trehalose-phosphatase n=1 Tax=Lunatimonas salinarum TaxID=1774590 RepID=UPI001AE05070|nr:bifunctional alpha,alpha-trehalose-phosphate synthase (UDP-forming)/trehalose-phosphatase [Lunatimonas salinarum]